MQTNIVVKFQVEGVHNWPEASKFEPTMKYLEHPHRHMFHIDARREVFHDDRDIEFIQFKRWLEGLYEGTLELDYKSCEMISDALATEIQNKYPKGRPNTPPFFYS